MLRKLFFMIVHSIHNNIVLTVIGIMFVNTHCKISYNHKKIIIFMHFINVWSE